MRIEELYKQTESLKGVTRSGLDVNPQDTPHDTSQVVFAEYYTKPLDKLGDGLGNRLGDRIEFSLGWI